MKYALSAVASALMLAVLGALGGLTVVASAAALAVAFKAGDG